MPAMKKKFPIKAFAVVNPRHSIKAQESVVMVVAKAPSANAVWNASVHFPCRADYCGTTYGVAQLPSMSPRTFSLGVAFIKFFQIGPGHHRMLI